MRVDEKMNFGSQLITIFPSMPDHTNPSLGFLDRLFENDVGAHSIAIRGALGFTTFLEPILAQLFVYRARLARSPDLVFAGNCLS
jgi:hypothetical protein